MMDSPDLSPGSSPWDTNRTNRTLSSGGKYESALLWIPAVIKLQVEAFKATCLKPWSAFQ